MKKKVHFLHIMGPDTKNSYGIMTQIHRTQDMSRHQFFITAYETCKERFPKLNDFDDNDFFPINCPWPQRLHKIFYFYKKLKKADVIVWHSLFFTTQKFAWFLFFFKHFQKKSVWVEWNADLYLWRFDGRSVKGTIKNYINRKIRERFRWVGIIFPVDQQEYERQFGKAERCFYTPMPNPYKEPTGMIDYILSVRPEEEKSPEKEKVIQVSHNAFTFNNHFYLLDMLKRFKGENVRLVVPLSYGVYGINGQYGGKAYGKAVSEFAKKTFGEKVSVLTKNMPFEKYIKFLWNIDVAVFDFNRPCGLGTLRILLLMGKKIYLPAGSPYYEFLCSQGFPIGDTNKIPEMTYEEFIAPVEYKPNKWLYEYLNNDCVADNWTTMFRELEKIVSSETDGKQ